MKPFARRRSLSCCSMATPMQKGKEELPNSSVSHRWKILCSGNTSREDLTKNVLIWRMTLKSDSRNIKVACTFLHTYSFFCFCQQNEENLIQV